MGRTIVVDPQKLTAAANQMDGIIVDYQKQYNKLFSDVDAMGAAWQGRDNQAFVNQIKPFMQDFNKMTTLMQQYSQFLKDSAKAYQTTQNNIVSSAQKLAN